MEHYEVLAIAGVLGAGLFCQWFAWKVKLPAILPLLAAGLVVGPVGLNLLHPREDLGHLFFPFVSLAVSIILFEGALTLNFREVRNVATVVRNLLVIGALISWLGGAVAAHYIMGMQWGLALLFGALIVVTGPTVIAPILRNVRPTPAIASILKWEGILIDPLGALVAVLVFDYIVAETAAVEGTIVGFFKILIIGSALGFAAGFLIYFVLKRYLVPDYLRDFMVLAVVMGTFAISSALASESGLLAVTVMGIVLANTQLRQLREIWYFKEKLSILLISTLFILLAANFTREVLGTLDWRAFAVLGVVMFVLRPMGIFLSGIGSTLERNEKLFLSWIAPRGIVAAAVSSLFTIELIDLGYTEAAILGPLVFLVIGGTVLIQGGTAKFVAAKLGVSEADPQGFLLMGVSSFSLALADALQDAGLTVRLVDNNYEDVSRARLQDLDTYYGNILSEFTENDIDLSGIGRLLALTRSDEANALACKHLEDEFGSSGVYQLPPRTKEPSQDEHSRFQLGRLLFDSEVTFDYIRDALRQGAVIKSTPLTDQFQFSDFRLQYQDRFVPLMAVRGKSVQIAAVDAPLEPLPNWTLIALVREPADRLDVDTTREVATEPM